MRPPSTRRADPGPRRRPLDGWSVDDIRMRRWTHRCLRNAVTADSPTTYLRLGELTAEFISTSCPRLLGSLQLQRRRPTAPSVPTRLPPTPPHSSAPTTARSNCRRVGRTRSATDLPSGNSARTVEFWARSNVGADRLPTVEYGAGTGAFRIQLGGDGKLWLATDAGQSYTSGQYELDLPAPGRTTDGISSP